VGSFHNHKTSPEIGKHKKKQGKRSFSLISTRATTTSTETGKTSKTNETMFNQWFAENAKI